MNLWITLSLVASAGKTNNFPYKLFKKLHVMVPKKCLLFIMMNEDQQRKTNTEKPSTA